MESDIENPWDVGNLEEFLYFCCPECDLKDRSKTHFLQHALTEHPKSKECVQQFNDFIIKEEPDAEDEIEENENCNSDIFEESYYPREEFSEILKCEIKEEPSENYDQDIWCGSCGKIFSNPDSLKLHLEIVHKMKHPCKLCTKEFRYELTLH